MKTFIFSFLLMSVLSINSWGQEIHCNDIEFLGQIHEIRFDDNGNWKLLMYYELREHWCTPTGEAKIDSIYLSTSTGIAKLRNIDSMKVITNYLNSFYTITSDSLTTDLYINNVSDSVTLIIYFDKYGEKVISKFSIVYGNFATSRIAPLRKGQSINNGGSTKMDNNTGHYLGWLKGKIYDSDGNIFIGFKNGWIAGLDLDSIGNFSTYLPACVDTLKQIVHRFSMDSYELITIRPIAYNVEPDSVYYADIYMIKNTGIPKLLNIKNANVIPNPVKDIATLMLDDNYDTIEIYSASGTRMNILNIRGKKELQIQSKNYTKGFYFFNLLKNKTVTAAGKFVVQ